MMNKNELFYKIANRTKTFYNKKFKTAEVRNRTFAKFGEFLALMVKYLLLYGLAFIILYPIFLQIAISLRAPEDINNPLVLWIPITYSLKNIEVSFIVLDYWNSLKNTLILSVFITILQLIVTSLVGYSLARLKFPGSNVAFVIVIFTIIVAPTTIELPMKINLLNFLGTNINLLGKTYILYIFAATGMGIKAGIFIYLFRQFFRGVPKEIEESALIDGANPFQVFLRIMLPNARGAIILTAILTFVWQWNDNYYIFKYVSEINASFDTLTTKMMGVSQNLQQALMNAKLWTLFSQDVHKNPLFLSMILNSSAILTMIPLLIIYVLVQKRLFTEGVERSGITG